MEENVLGVARSIWVPDGVVWKNRLDHFSKANLDLENDWEVPLKSSEQEQLGNYIL